MNFKDELDTILGRYIDDIDNIGLVECLPLELKLDIIALVITKLEDGKCNNPVYNGFSYRLPFLELISYYNQATDLHKTTGYLPFIKCSVRLAERLLKAHLKDTTNV